MDLDALQRALDHARDTGDHTDLNDVLVDTGWVRAKATQADILANVAVNPDTGCWEWTGRLDDAGYGNFGRRGAHRLSWEAFVGPIPRGFHIDHVCRNRRCVRPELTHLEPVTPEENNRRAMTVVQETPDQRVHHAAKRWCSKGHEYTEDNTWRDKRGRRYCLTCRRNWSDLNRRRRNKAPRSYVERHIDHELWARRRLELPPYEPGEVLIRPEVAAEMLGYKSANSFAQFRQRNQGVLDPAPVPRPVATPYFYRLIEIEVLAQCQTEHNWTKRPRLYDTNASERARQSQSTDETATPPL